MKRFVICRICEQFPPRPGGLASGMLNLSLAQHKIGHTLIVITRCYPGDLKFDLELPFKVIRIPAKRLLSFGWKAYGEIKKFSIRPEIVHSHGPAAFSYLLRRKKDDAPLVHTMHTVRKYQYDLYRRSLQELKQTGLPSPLKYSWVSPFIQREYFLEYHVCHRADHIVTVARFFADELTMHYDLTPQKITTVLNGTSFGENGLFSRVESFSPPNLRKSKILFVGRFDWHKRIDLLVRAMPLVIQAFPHAQLVLVGDGEMRSHLEKLMKSLGLSSKIIFPGWVSIEKISNFYNNADCFCLPSISEGLPKVILEAMGTGLPIISADNKAARELLQNGKYGLLIKHPSPEAWGRGIIGVLTGGVDIEEKAKNGLALINKTYRWNQVARRLDAAYQKVLME